MPAFSTTFQEFDAATPRQHMFRRSEVGSLLMDDAETIHRVYQFLAKMGKEGDEADEVAATIASTIVNALVNILPVRIAALAVKEVVSESGSMDASAIAENLRDGERVLGSPLSETGKIYEALPAYAKDYAARVYASMVASA